MSFYAGKTGFVTIGAAGVPGAGIRVALKKWSFNVDQKLINVNNFQSKGCNQYVAGFVGAEITVSGVFPVGIPDLAIAVRTGTVVSMTLGIIGPADGPLVAWSIPTAWIQNITVDDDAEDAPQFSMKLVSNCCFDLIFPLSKNGC